MLVGKSLRRNALDFRLSIFYENQIQISVLTVRYIDDIG